MYFYCNGCPYLEQWIDAGYEGEPSNVQSRCCWSHDGGFWSGCPRCPKNGFSIKGGE